MPSLPSKPTRRSIRLPEHHYSKPGAYFVTICCHEKQYLFGDLQAGVMRLNPFGEIILEVWRSLPEKFPEIELDAFIVMPNHIHAIIVINAETTDTDPNRRRMILSKSVGFLKMNAAKRINLHRDTPGQVVWQRNYYERVIRNEREMESIRDYIVANPAKWDDDPERQERLDRLRVGDNKTLNRE